MNANKRRALKSAITLLDRASNIVEDIKDKEEDSLDNMPENLKESERGEHMEFAIESLDDVISQIDDVKESINNVVWN